jgi:peptidoglycan hydrolase-like protein with peptidoglycan-binding domain
MRARLRSMGDRELGPGTEGDDVKALQKLLGVPQTGTYADLTAFAVGQFQARHGLKATGIADAATKRKLARREHPPKNPPTPPAPSTPPAGSGSRTGGAGASPNGSDPRAQAPARAARAPHPGAPRTAPRAPARPADNRELSWIDPPIGGKVSTAAARGRFARRR